MIVRPEGLWPAPRVKFDKPAEEPEPDLATEVNQ